MREQKSPYRFAERCLYTYKENLARLEVLREDLRVIRSLSSVKVQDYDYNTISSTPGGHGDPVVERLLRIEHLEEKITGLERRTKPITRLLEDLESPYVLEESRRATLLKILQYVYLGGNSWQDAANELRLGRSAFFDRRRELVNIAIRYLGF